jgi:hypothetical protein
VLLELPKYTTFISKNHFLGCGTTSISGPEAREAGIELRSRAALRTVSCGALFGSYLSRISTFGFVASKKYL